MLCPHCQVDLHMTERQGIEIDYCPKCRGVWLDRGELDKILERSREAEPAAPAAAASPQPAPPQAAYPPQQAYPPPQQGYPPQPYPAHDPRYADRRKYDEHYGKRRKKSFFEEIFD